LPQSNHWIRCFKAGSAMGMFLLFRKIKKSLRWK